MCHLFDRVMLSMMVFLLLVCFGIAYFTSTWTLTAVVGIPALLVPWAIYQGAPGSLASRIAISCALMVFSALSIQQSQGNLQRRVMAQALGELDLLKQNINQSLDALRSAMSTIHGNARQVAVASDEASNAIGQISDGARSQTDAISQVSNAVRQTVTSVSEVSQNTELASQKSRQSFVLVRASMAKMDEMVKVVNNIASNSEKINKITEVIEGIANKTNLLSLNAAIEAARAGEHGKGFAVVADEVGKLALNSAESSQEIAILVKQAVEEARSAVTAVGDVSKDMLGIERETQATDEMLQRIASALEEQSNAVEKINSNLNNLDQIAQSNSAASEEIAATVVELYKIAVATQREVQQFQI